MPTAFGRLVTAEKKVIYKLGHLSVATFLLFFLLFVNSHQKIKHFYLSIIIKNGMYYSISLSSVAMVSVELVLWGDEKFFAWNFFLLDGDN